MVLSNSFFIPLKQTNLDMKSDKTKASSKSNTFTSIVRADLRVDCIKEFKFHQTRRWRFDYAIPEHKIALEVEGGIWTGGRHTRPQGFLGDIEKYNTATIMGWKVLRTTPKDLYSNKTIKLIKSAINGEI